MTHRASGAMLCLISLVLLSGCLSVGGGLAMPSAERDRYTLIEKSTQSAAGCHYDYRIYQPTESTTTTSVILGHGFLRDQNNMIGLSRHLANTGIRVVTLNFCNMRPWNGHHERNADDMRNLAEALGVHKDVVYAGFSAGALAAILASDNQTQAILTLDLVDQNDLGLSAIEQLDVPLIGLSGPASGCNAQNKAHSVFSARPDHALTELTQIDGASHCEFETPSNWLCEAACGDKQDDPDADTLETDKIVRLIVNKLMPFLGPSR